MQTVLFVIALSVDVFLASAACGMDDIKIGIRTALCISGICSGVLLFSLAAGMFFGETLTERAADILCFTGLLLIGVYKLAEYGIRRYIRQNKFLCKRIKITFSQLNFIVSVYNNPVMADKDQSKEMSVQEGAAFALAMSADGLFGGVGAALLGLNLWGAAGLHAVLGVAAVCLGNCLGRFAVKKSSRDFSWIGGAMFVALAFTKIV